MDQVVRIYRHTAEEYRSLVVCFFIVGLILGVLFGALGMSTYKNAEIAGRDRTIANMETMLDDSIEQQFKADAAAEAAYKSAKTKPVVTAAQ